MAAEKTVTQEPFSAWPSWAHSWPLSRGSVRARVRVMAMVRVKVKVRARVRVMARARVRVMDRVRARVITRVLSGLGLGVA